MTNGLARHAGQIVPSRGFEISFAFEINNLAIQPVENRTHEPYTIRGGCGQLGGKTRNLMEFLPNPAYAARQGRRFGEKRNERSSLGDAI